MIQPETWKAIGEYSGKVWTAVGPLIGVLIGGWLGRAWDIKKWELENRKEECRELLASISLVTTIRKTVGRGHSEQEAYDAYVNSVKIFLDRIFIAADIKKAHLADAWARAVREVGEKQITNEVFAARVIEIKNTIIGLAVPKVGTRFSPIGTVKRILRARVPTEPL